MQVGGVVELVAEQENKMVLVKASGIVKPQDNQEKREINKMEHKITIEIFIKTDFLKSEKEITPNIHTFKINPEIIDSLIPNLMGDFFKSLAKEFPKEKPKKNKPKVSKTKPKRKK